MSRRESTTAPAARVGPDFKIPEEIDDLMHRVPFQPFTVRLTSGDRYTVNDVALAALLRSSIFIAFPNSDRRVIVPYLHIAAVETGNGTRKAPPRRRSV